MKQNKLTIFVFALLLMIMSYTAVFAEDTVLPAFMISDIIPDKSVTIVSRDFPADSEYIISMSGASDLSKYIDLARFNTREGGSFIVTVDIPEELKGSSDINLLLTGPDGSIIPGTFVNVESAVDDDSAALAKEETAEPVAKEEKTETAAEEAKTAEEPVEPVAEEEKTETAAEEVKAAEEPVEPVAEEEKTETAAEEAKAAEESVEENKLDDNLGQEIAVSEVVEVPVEEKDNVTDSVSEPVVASATDEVVETVSYEGVPTIGIKNVTKDESIDLHGENFPKRKTFMIAMSDFTSYSGLGYEVLSHDMGESDSFNLNVAIPEELKGVQQIAINVYSDDGYYANNWFYNGEVTENAVVDGSETAISYSEPVPPYASCNFSIIPSFSIVEVTRGVDVTISTVNFPTNSTFSVMMGHYSSLGNESSANWQRSLRPRNPSPLKRPSRVNPYTNPQWFDSRGLYGWFKNENETTYSASTLAQSFTGVEVGTYETGDGSSQTLTFNIPEEQKFNSPIVIWIKDTSICGFYAYNYFYNVSTNTTDLPELEAESNSEDDVSAEMATDESVLKEDESAGDVTLVNQEETAATE